MSEAIETIIETLKFTSNVFFHLDANHNLHVLTEKGNLSINVNKNNIYYLSSLLKVVLEEKLVIGWNFKNFFTTYKFWTNHEADFEFSTIDLKIAESFIGIHHDLPKDFQEAKKRLSIIVKHTSWESFKNIHSNIYKPLYLKILPAVETEGVVKDNTIIYPVYEIEGSVNGRLTCNKSLGFNPHIMKTEERLKCFPKYHNKAFIYLDFQNMEVAMLAWLSKDENLLSMVCDFYNKLFYFLSGKEANENQRQFCKSVFLPVVFGESTKSVAEKLSISLETANGVIDKLKKKFAKAFSWVENYESEDGLYKDYFGRCRKFDGLEYKYRNFIIQSPSAVFCLEKLVKLYDALHFYANITASIHDGYLISVDKKRIQEIEIMAKDILESESKICPGLKIKVNSKISDNFC